MNRNSEYDGEHFLNIAFPNLLHSQIVQLNMNDGDPAEVAIRKYLERVSRFHDEGREKNHSELVKKFYYDRYVVRRDALISHSVEEQAAIIEAQKRTLGRWIDFLMNSNCPYPLWVREWIFQGVLRMGSYNVNSSDVAYSKRTKKTTAPFLDINIGVVEDCVREIMEIASKSKSEMKNFNFETIFVKYDKQYREKQAQKLEGKWIQYQQGSEEDAMKLFQSLQNHNLPWCTASSSTYAMQQVCGSYVDAPEGGDFYVYYTRDDRGEFTVPRIAMRMIGKTKIGEIRGIKDGQNMEEEMYGVLEAKLREMPFLSSSDVNHYMNMIDKLRKFGELKRKVFAARELTNEELIFLYTPLSGFGFHEDDDIRKPVLNKRDIVTDWKRIEYAMNPQDQVAFLINNTNLLESKGIKTLIYNKNKAMQLLAINPNVISFCSKDIIDDSELRDYICEISLQKYYSLILSDLFWEENQNFALELFLRGVKGTVLTEQTLEEHFEQLRPRLLENSYAISTHISDDFWEKHQDYVMEFFHKNKRLPFGAILMYETLEEYFDELESVILNENYVISRKIPEKFWIDHQDFVIKVFKKNSFFSGNMFFTEKTLEEHFEEFRPILMESSSSRFYSHVSNNFWLRHVDFLLEYNRKNHSLPVFGIEFDVKTIEDHFEELRPFLLECSSVLPFSLSDHFWADHQDFAIELFKTTNGNFSRKNFLTLETVEEHFEELRPYFLKNAGALPDNLSSEFWAVHQEFILEFLQCELQNRGGRNYFSTWFLSELTYESLESHFDFIMQFMKASKLNPFNCYNFNQRFLLEHYDEIRDMAVSLGYSVPEKSNYLNRSDDIFDAFFADLFDELGINNDDNDELQRMLDESDEQQNENDNQNVFQ